MAEYRIFYFWEGVLQDSELLDSPDLIEAVRHASRQSPHLRAEIWSGGERLAVVRPSRIITHVVPAG